MLALVFGASLGVATLGANGYLTLETLKRLTKSLRRDAP